MHQDKQKYLSASLPRPQALPSVALAFLPVPLKSWEWSGYEDTKVPDARWLWCGIVIL